MVRMDRMKTLLGLRELDLDTPRVATLGVFDGMHRGHRVVLARLVAEARKRHAVATAITFEPHPDAVIRGAPPPRLADPEQLIEGMREMGVDELVIHPFDQAFSRLGPEAFLRLVGAGRGLRAFLMSPETAFGKDRSGTIEVCAAIGKRLGFDVIVVKPVLLGGQPVSSSRIRRSLAEGHIGDARRLLGRAPTVTGRVVEGAGRGRDLGFPTANLGFDVPVALPSDGVYAVRTTWRSGEAGRGSGDAEWRSGDGVASLGVRPTFGGGERLLEVYLFDVDERLYGAAIRVAFERRLRGERRFASPAALVRQMERDAERAREVLGI
jgi:riboflavin kinase/FMN adenylyltransferase